MWHFREETCTMAEKTAVLPLLREYRRMFNEKHPHPLCRDGRLKVAAHRPVLGRQRARQWTSMLEMVESIPSTSTTAGTL